MNPGNITEWARAVASLLPERYTFSVITGVLLGVVLNALEPSLLHGEYMNEVQWQACALLAALSISRLMDRLSPRTALRERLAPLDVLFELGQFSAIDRRLVCRKLVDMITRDPKILRNRLDWRLLMTKVTSGNTPRDEASVATGYDDVVVQERVLHAPAKNDQ